MIHCWLPKQRLLSKVRVNFVLSFSFAIASFWAGCGALLAVEDPAPNVDENRWQAAQQLLLDKCIDCHGPDTQESQLRLDSRQGISRGGDFGAIVGKSADDSELLNRVASRNPELQMPPGEPLSEEEVRILAEWIAAGYPWDRELEESTSSSRDDGSSHWAWQPISPPIVPEFKLDSGAGNEKVESARNPIDHFVRSLAIEKGLPLSPPADRRTLIRRLSYDVLGLPPSFEEVEQFVADTSPTAYEELVDRYLSSPRYGERWARHWLDVVHYGDSHGYDKDQPRNNAWPYRDYVVQSFNEDKDYSQFVREQIAGDVLNPESYRSVIATGFLSAGPWDQIGHLEVPETKTDGKIARHLDRDDMVANTIGTFCSITIHCAQCHNHKFDPIPQTEYYELQSVFAAVDRNDRPYSKDPETMKRIIETEKSLYEAESNLDAIKQQLKEMAGREFERWESSRVASRDGEKTHGGYHSAIANSADESKWVQIDLGKPYSLSKIVLHPCFDSFASIGAGFGFPVRFKIEVSNDENFVSNVELVVARNFEGNIVSNVEEQIFPLETSRVVSTDRDAKVAVDSTAVDSTVVGPNGLGAGLAVANEGSAESISAWRFVRVTATQLAKRENDFIFALAECEVFDDQGVNVATGKPVTSLDSIEAPERWRRTNLVDGVSSAIAKRSREGAEQIAQEKMIEAVGIQAWNDFNRLDRLVKQLADQVNSFGSFDKVYAANARVRRGKPRPIHLLARGNVNTPRDEVSPAALGLVSTLPRTFELANSLDEGERRLQLANWITSKDNPLTWRSIANRVWQYHFGAGIVATSSDFGMMGATPTHPELLDWLALQLMNHDGSLKHIHRLILTSATYRQSSDILPAHQELDSSNQYLARFTRYRLDAESIRDAILLAAGSLDQRMGGPGWRDFQMLRPEHSPHYRYDLADPADTSTWRRSIYRFVARSQTQPFLTSLDCADPSMRVEKRNSSITALQSLSMLNNAMVMTQSREFAELLQRKVREVRENRLKQDSVSVDNANAITIAFQRALGRSPTPGELSVMLELSDEAGLENACRVMFNLNEFVFVD